jgi:hypothetical protein
MYIIMARVRQGVGVCTFFTVVGFILKKKFSRRATYCDKIVV